MNRSKLQLERSLRYRPWGSRAVCVASATLFMISIAGIRSAGETAGYKPVRTPGGLSARPAITSMTHSNKQLTVKWTGFAGPYQVERCPAASGGAWKSVATVTNKTLSLPVEGEVGFVRISGAAPNYVGAETCLMCHSDPHESWTKTAHAGAFQSLKAIKQDKNAACLPCHTLGFGLPTGFKDETSTPLLAGVQCENCHGPGGDHAKKPKDLTLRPVKTISADMCGGCHTDAHHPTIDEWETTLHAEVNEHTAEYFRSPTGEARMLACGACHSGSVRMAMLKAKESNKGVTLPTKEEAATVGITCAVCHDPHVKTANGGQLRNPLGSTKPFSYSTGTNTTFAAQYDAQVSICGQCHNARGATWKDTGRAPHHSLQYNMLTATIGYLSSTNAPRQSAHATQIADQCAHCHVQSHSVADPTESNPNYTGHGFEAHLTSCQPCHIDAEDAASKIESTQADIKRRIQSVKALLDEWGKTKSDAALRTKYGALAWEYNTVGDISDLPGILGAKGPTAAEQALVPDEIKQARFNIYVVAHDQSYGVHNTKYAQDLLKIAADLVNAKLAPAAQPATIGSAPSESVIQRASN